jgi:hypothetical protein
VYSVITGDTTRRYTLDIWSVSESDFGFPNVRGNITDGDRNKFFVQFCPVLSSFVQFWSCENRKKISRPYIFLSSPWFEELIFNRLLRKVRFFLEGWVDQRFEANYQGSNTMIKKVKIGIFKIFHSQKILNPKN